MKREEALRIIKECKEKGFKHTFYTLNEYHTALDIAIKALEQEPCEDAISRQAVLDRIRESIETYHNQYTTDMLNMWGLFTQFIKEMPPVNPQPKTGHWIKKDGYSDCSECNSHIVTEWDFCAKCGARMVAPQESEE